MSVRKKTKANIGKHFSKLQLGLIVIIFASLGGYIIINSFAATSSVTPVPAANVNGVTVGGGFVEASARQVIRTANNTVYVITADDDLCQAGGAGVIHAWKGTGAQAANAQVPTAFVEQDAANRPTSTTGDCTFNSTHALFSPESRLNPSGVIEMAYINGSNSNVYYQTFSTITNTWGVPVVIGSNANTNSGGGWPRGGHVSLTLDSNNVPHVVYVTSGSSNQLMYTNKTSGSWSTPVSIASGTNMMHPSMVTSQDGNFHLAWLDNSLATHSTIKYSKHTSTGWSTAETVSAGDNLVLNNTDDDQGPSIVTNSSGEPYVLFMDGTGSASTQDNYVRMRYRNTAGTWQDNSPPNNLFAHTPQNYISSTGDIYAFLGHDVNVQFGYQSQTGGFGNSWNPYATLDPRNQTNTTAGAPGLDGSASVRYDPLRDNNPGIIDVIYYDENDGSTSGHHATVFYKAIVLGSTTPTCTATSTSNFATNVSNAKAGDTLCLATGNYGTWTGTNKAITVTAANGQSVSMALDFGSGTKDLTVDGTLLGGTITISSGSIHGQSGNYNFQSDAPHNVTIKNSAFTGPIRIDYLVDNGAWPFSILLDHNTHNNISADGGRIYVDGPNNADSGVIVQNSTLRDNEADGVQSFQDIQILNNEFDNIQEGAHPAFHTDSIQVFGTGGKTVIRGNWIHNGSDGLTQYDGGAGMMIENNVISSDDPGRCLELYYDQNSTIRHNTLYGGCGIDLNHKTADPPGSGTIVKDNIVPGGISFSSQDGKPPFSTAAVNTNNLIPSASSPNIPGTATFIGGNLPTTYAGFALTNNSSGHLSGTDGKDLGVDLGSTTPPPTCTKSGDINCDNAVNVTDLSILLSNYGKTTTQLTSSTPSYPRADINTSGKVDIGDLSALLTGYGK